MSYLFTLDYQLQSWGKVMQDLLMLHLNHLHHITHPFSDRGKVRNDNVLDASLTTNILDLPIILLRFWSRVFPFDSSLLWVQFVACAHVQLQIPIAAKGFGTALALEFLQVDIFMIFQARLLCKGDPTPRTREGLGSAVHNQVGLEIRLAAKGLLTMWAANLSLDSLLTCVHADMSSQTAGAAELGATVDAEELLFDPLVDQLEVFHQSLLSFELLAAVFDATDEWLFTGKILHRSDIPRDSKALIKPAVA